MAAAYVYEMDDVDEEEIVNEVETWCMNLTNVEADIWLNDFGLRQNGSRLARADRLARRLCGDYTAADFVRTDMNASEIDESLNRIEVRAAVENSQLSQRAQDYITHRRQRRNRIREQGEESQLAHPLADSTGHAGDDTNAFVLGYFPMTRVNRSSNFVPVASTGMPAIVTSIHNTNAGNVAITVLTSSDGTATSAAPSQFNNANIAPTGANTAQGNNAPGAQPRQHLVRCQMPNGEYYDVQRELALQIIELQQAAEYVRMAAEQPTPEMPNYSAMRQGLLAGAQNRASSTHIAPQVAVSQRNDTALGARGEQPGRRRSVALRDTFDLRYYERDEIIDAQAANANSVLDPINNASRLNANAFEPRGALPRRTTQPAEAIRPVRPTPGRGGTLVLSKQPRVSALPISPRSL